MAVTGQPVAVAAREVVERLLVVRVLRNVSEIDELRDFWRQWQRHPNCDFDFYQKVLQTLPSIERPHVLVAYRGVEPEAMLVGRLEKSSVDFSIGYRKLAAIPVRSLTFLHGGYVGKKTPETARVFLESILDALSRREADVAYFNHLRTDEPLYREIGVLPKSLCHSSVGVVRNHRGMTLAANADGFRRKLGTKERNNQKRREKRIQEEFGEKVRIEAYGSPSDITQIVKDVDLVAKKTYQRALGVGFEDTPSVRERLQVEAERGWLRAYIFYLAEHPCAFWMGDVYAGIFYSGFTGYDPSYSKYAPGMFLLLKAMEMICDENTEDIPRTADFGLGDAEWKLIIGDLEWQEASVHLFARSSKGRILRSMHSGSSLVESWARKVIGQGRFVAKIKKVWRRRLSRKAG